MGALIWGIPVPPGLVLRWCPRAAVSDSLVNVVHRELWVAPVLQGRSVFKFVSLANRLGLARKAV